MQSGNLYGFCMNNPIRFIDPSGFDAADTFLFLQSNPRPDMSVSNGFGIWMDAILKESSKPSLVTQRQLTDMGFKNVSYNMFFELNLTLKIYSILSSTEISHFLAQCSYESDWGRGIIEYDNAAGTYLKSKSYYPYYGAGYIQLTGERNYIAFSEAMGDPRILEGPDYVAANYAWRAAGWWWNSAGMNSRIESGYTINNVSGQVTAWNKNAPDNGSYTARSNNYYTIFGVLTR